jgi:hypothetical protein
MVIAFVEFLEQHHKDVDKFLIHILRAIGDETWVSFVNVETKEKSKQWMHARVVILPDNVPSHTTARTRALLENFN